MGLPILVVKLVPLSPSPPSTTSTVMYVVELSASLTCILVHFIIVKLEAVCQQLWMELMLWVCPTLTVHQVVAPMYGHMLEATKKQDHILVTAPVPSHLVPLLLRLLVSIITVRVLHSIALLIIAGTQTIPYGTMRTVIQEAIAVYPTCSLVCEST